jgi:hypothetical protein
VDPEYVETQPTSSPRFESVEPHPSSPAGQVQMWGTLARRVGAARLRAVIVAGLVVMTVLVVVQVAD